MRLQVSGSQVLSPYIAKTMCQSLLYFDGKFTKSICYNFIFFKLFHIIFERIMFRFIQIFLKQAIWAGFTALINSFQFIFCNFILRRGFIFFEAYCLRSGRLFNISINYLSTTYLNEGFTISPCLSFFNVLFLLV